MIEPWIRNADINFCNDVRTVTLKYRGSDISREQAIEDLIDVGLSAEDAAQHLNGLGARRREWGAL